MELSRSGAALVRSELTGQRSSKRAIRSGPVRRATCIPIFLQRDTTS
ncbi:unnamed protein product [Cuscuta europaea]|uniref:Uncharacterized protein n=1 Tax=Cuscuta europaea TaxID=41803 RepID=A0A9P1EC94_CUSEU|nr:unnamed protein product [Cuscuta europaea]